MITKHLATRISGRQIGLLRTRVGLQVWELNDQNQ